MPNLAFKILDSFGFRNGGGGGGGRSAIDKPQQLSLSICLAICLFLYLTDVVVGCVVDDGVCSSSGGRGGGGREGSCPEKNVKSIKSN